MTDAARLHAAVLATPDDIAVRLEFADAIDAVDPDRAELIRAQIEFARLEHARLAVFDVGPRPDGVVLAARRGHDLVRRIGGRLTAPIAGLVRKAYFACGFPEVVELSGKSFLDNGRALYDLVPVRHAILRDVDAGLVAELAVSPLLDQLVSIVLQDCRIGDDGVRALVASEHLRGLRLLDLTNCGIGAAGAEAIAESAPVRLPSLQWLGFAQNTPFIPYGAGVDAISGQSPVDVYVPELGVRLNERYGPFPWMRREWADLGVRPSFGTV